MDVQSCIIPTSEYKNFLLRLAQSVGSHWPDDLRPWHNVYCDKCGAEWTAEALDMLLALGPGSGFERTSVIVVIPT